MFPEKHQISCRVHNTVLKYLKEHGKDVGAFLEGLPCDEEYLSDTNNWISWEMGNEISRRMRALFDDDEILYKVALSSEKLHSLGFLDHAIRLMGAPRVVLSQAPRINRYFNKVDDIEVVKMGPSSAVIKYYIKAPGLVMTKDDCYYTKGVLTILPTAWGSAQARVQEESCAVPIDKAGRLNGKFYTVDKNGYVSEHDCAQEEAGRIAPAIIGRLNSDGTFKLGRVLYGARYCLYHMSWPPYQMLIKKFFYNIFFRPKALGATIDQMHLENDLIQKKYEELYRKNTQLKGFYIDTINAFIRAIDAKDHYTERHSINVSSIAETIAKELKLPADKVEAIRQACKLHDLGKIGIKDSILLKPAKLTEEEWRQIKMHPILGAEIIKPIAFLSDIALLIRQDHERWDGKGYPEGLKEEQIDIGARIIAVADAYDAMVSGRPYRSPLSKQEAIDELKKNAGTQFDPKVIEAFLNTTEQKG